ncbi:MAG TPA: phospholipase D-like domain-containing protein [Polyangia bacterium]|nr:phospholipase D-like domain-containing protein [Polyangia bacterium]
MDFVDPTRRVRAALVAGRGHYDTVLRAVAEASRSIWIATANLKELMVEDPRAAPGRARTRRRSYRSVLAVLDELAGRGVELRILHAGFPSRAFREELDRHPRLFKGGLQLRTCPRLHFKVVVVDGAFLYLGSANWTGAGLGAKGAGRRNFELGFVTGDDGLLDRVQFVYDRIWNGGECGQCKLREVCPGPLDITEVRPAPPDPPRLPRSNAA